MKHKPPPAVSTALNRIEGQIRGIAKMVEEERYCIDIVTQVEAVRAALARVNADLLRGHIEHCVHEAMQSPNAANRKKVVEELVGVFRKRS
jgi:DNA-binding FrmR family transcriptional regulator